MTINARTGQVGSARIVVVGVVGQNAAQVTLIDDQHVIEALAADRSDDALGTTVLPRPARRNWRSRMAQARKHPARAGAFIR